MNGKESTKRLTVCAMLSALGVVLLFLGSVINVIDISMAVIASLLCIFAVIEYGKSAPWLIFTVTSILSLLLLPAKTPAVMYLLFFGYYPILKEKFEKRPRIVAWLLKELMFNLALIVLLVLSHFVLFPGGELSEMVLYYLLIAVMAEIAFPLYDIALTRLISLYLLRIRPRFRLK